MTGTVVNASATELAINVSTSHAYPSNLTLTKLNQTITLAVPATALIQSVDSNGVVRAMSSVSLAARDQKVVVWTQPAPATLKAQRGDPGALTAALIQLR